MINEKVVLGNLLLPRDVVHLVDIEGEIVWADTSKILQKLNQKLKNEVVVSKRKKILRIVTEILDNIVRYKSVNPPDIFMGIQTSDKFYFLSQNNIPNNKVSEILEKLLWVNSLDKKQLETEYRKQLKNLKCIDSGGAGLGLIEMARKSENPIQFNIEFINETSSFLTIMTTINID